MSDNGEKVYRCKFCKGMFRGRQGAIEHLVCRPKDKR